jgi:glycosyltransferase involved in cell wall biosynthesis
MSLAGQRILFVLNSLELGGAERQTIGLARWLREQESVIPIVVGFERMGRAAERCTKASIPVHYLGSPISSGRTQSALGLIRLAWQLRQLKPDLILAFTVIPNLACGLVWRLSGARAFVWNQRDIGMGLQSGGLMRTLAIRSTPAFVSNSAHGACMLAQDLGVDPQRIRVIRNGIFLPQTRHDRAAVRQRLGINPDAFVGCMVANITAFKDHQTLLDAWRIVVDELTASGQQALLLLAGREDGAFPALQKQCESLGLGGHVRFLGSIADIDQLLCAVDAGIHSSRAEGSPNGILECMAMGLPVIATDCAGNREALGPGSSDLLAPIGDARALARKIVDLASSASAREERGRQNRQRIGAEFSVEAGYGGYARLIAGLIDR